MMGLFHAKVVSVPHVLRLDGDGVNTNIDYKPKKLKEQAVELINPVLKAYANSRKINTAHVPRFNLITMGITTPDESGQVEYADYSSADPV